MLKTDEELMAIVRTPMQGWPDRLAVMPEADMVTLRDWAMATAIRLAQIAEYTEYVSAKQGHEKALKALNKRAEAVRKALGYAYPKDDVTF